MRSSVNIVVENPPEEQPVPVQQIDKREVDYDYYYDEPQYTYWHRGSYFH